ncbi:MAG: two pore domain potassium channel family protein [Rhodobacteraceae bacterium]|nr:two pore domain potassium channel family protein [Paracoccaceae bacterium]
MAYTWVFFTYFVEALLRLAPILGLLVTLIVINGMLIGRIEGWRRTDALYHAFINATTVGYGDFRPSSTPGKILSVLNAFMGLLFTGIFVGTGVYSVEKSFDILQ